MFRLDVNPISKGKRAGTAKFIPPINSTDEAGDGAIVNRRFNRSINDNVGNGDVYQDAAIAQTDELFGCSVRELYQATGGKRNDRSTLPQPAQEAYMVNESLTANELERLIGTIGGEDQEEVNNAIVGVVRQQSKRTRKWLPW